MAPPKDTTSIMGVCYKARNYFRYNTKLEYRL